MYQGRKERGRARGAGGRLAILGWLLGALACGDAVDSGPVQPASPQAPQIALLSPELAALLVEFGLAGAVVAADASSAARPELAGAVSLGDLGPTDVDTAAAAAPDFVLGLRTPPQQRFAAALEARGLAVELFDPRDVNEVAQTVIRLGSLLDRDLRAAATVARLNTEVARIATARDGSRRLRVAWLANADPLVAIGGSGLLHEILELAGAENVFHLEGQPRVEVAAAELASQAPDLVLDSTGGRLADALLQSAGRVVEVAPELTALPTLDLLYRVQRMHQILYASD